MSFITCSHFPVFHNFSGLHSLHLLYINLTGRRIQEEINVCTSLLQAGVAKKEGGGGLSPPQIDTVPNCTSNTLIECSVSKILSKIRPILSLFFHNNYDLTEILQSSEVWGTIKPKLPTASGGHSPCCQRFYTASAPPHLSHLLRHWLQVEY